MNSINRTIENHSDMVENEKYKSNVEKYRNYRALHNMY